MVEFVRDETTSPTHKLFVAVDLESKKVYTTIK